MASEETEERTVWVSRDQVESIIPADLVEELDIEAGDDVEIRPKLDDATISWHVHTGLVDEDRVNARKIKRRVEPFEQTVLRFPAALSAVSGLERLVNERNVSMEYQRADDGFFVESWPPLRPWMIPSDRDSLPDVETYSKRLQQLPGKEILFLPTSHVDALGIEKGQPVAWRLSMADGRFALVADLDIPDRERGGRHIRKMQASQSGTEDHPVQQFHLYVPRAVVHALHWENSELALEAGEDYLRLTPDHDGDLDQHEVDSEVLADAEESASAETTA